MPILARVHPFLAYGSTSEARPAVSGHGVTRTFLALLLCSVAVGCGGGNSTSVTTSPTAPSSSSTPASVAGAYTLTIRAAGEFTPHTRSWNATITQNGSTISLRLENANFIAVGSRASSAGRISFDGLVISEGGGDITFQSDVFAGEASLGRTATGHSGTWAGSFRNRSEPSIPSCNSRHAVTLTPR